MTNMIKVLVVEPGKTPEVREIDGSLESFQKIVGGYIERLPLPGVDVYVNEDGRSMKLPFNRNVQGFAVLGSMVIAGHNGGESVSLSDDEIVTWMVAFTIALPASL